MSEVPATSIETLTLWLIQARQAYHDVTIGEKVVRIMADGYLTEFSRANADSLLAYIRRLEAQIANNGVAPAVSGLSVVF